MQQRVGCPSKHAKQGARRREPGAPAGDRVSILRVQCACAHAAAVDGEARGRDPRGRAAAHVPARARAPPPPQPPLRTQSQSSFFLQETPISNLTTRGSLHSNCREQFSSCLRQCAHQPYGMNYWLAIAKRWNTHDKPGRKGVGGGAAWRGERIAERAHGRQRNVPHAPPAPRLGSRAQGSR